MKRAKKIFKTFGILLLILILFRGWIYKKTVKYVQINARQTIQITNPELIELIKKEKNGRILKIDQIIKIARNISTTKLAFTTQNVSTNPNQTFTSGKANCVGYSSLFNSIGEYLINTQKENGKYRFNHLVGRLNFLGINLNQYFTDPFFRDHDYNEIVNLETGRSIYVDPTICDYLGIYTVSVKN